MLWLLLLSTGLRAGNPMPARPGTSLAHTSRRLASVVVASDSSDEAREKQMSELRRDIESFKQASQTDMEDAESPTLLRNTIDTLGTVLSYNSLIICAFFAWFLAAVAGQYVVKDMTLITAFRGYWDVLILPLLSTHMALTFLSAGLERFARSDSR